MTPFLDGFMCHVLCQEPRFHLEMALTGFTYRKQRVYDDSFIRIYSKYIFYQYHLFLKNPSVRISPYFYRFVLLETRVGNDTPCQRCRAFLDYMAHECQDSIHQSYLACTIALYP